MEATNSISRSTLNRLALYMVCLLGCVVIGASLFSLLDSFSVRSAPLFSKTYLLPGILLVMVVLFIPPVFLLASRKFDLFHPLVYAVWIYFFPAFVLGSLYFATGRYEPHFIDLIPDQEHYIPLALLYVAIGFASLSLGFFIPQAKKWGEDLAKRLPGWEWDVDQVILPALILLLVGRLFELMAFSVGAVGYQSTDSPSAFGTTYFSFSLLGSMANVLLWIAMFRAKRFLLRHYLAICILVVLIPYSMIIAGGRGELLRNSIAIFFAYGCSGRRLRIRHMVVAGFLVIAAVVVGMVYGTLFRLAKGDVSRVGIAENIEIGLSTINEIRQSNVAETLGFAVEKAFERFETVTSLSVIVANYKQLRPFESDVGVANNIWTDTWTAFIPRFVWPEKPLISDARAIAALYFEYPDNSYAITPIGDLLRNFGPIGIPVGMAVLGAILRIIYSGLVEGKQGNSWRSACYYLLLVNISYEGFYGSIFPGLLRVVIVSSVGIYLLNWSNNVRNSIR